MSNKSTGTQLLPYVVASDVPRKVDPTGGKALRSFCTPLLPSPLSSAPSSPDSSVEEPRQGQIPSTMVEINTAKVILKNSFETVRLRLDLKSDPIQLPPDFEKADEQARLWSAALRTKKVAMENMLKAQKSLEDIELALAQHLSLETIQVAHTRFLSSLDPSDPDSSYLLTIGNAIVNPIPSRLNMTKLRVRAGGNFSNATRGGSSHTGISNAMTAQG